MTHQANYSSLIPDILCACEGKEKREKELIYCPAHFLKLKKIAIIKLYHANPNRGLYIHFSDCSGFMLISFIIPKLLIYP